MAQWTEDNLIASDSETLTFDDTKRSTEMAPRGRHQVD